MPDTLEPHPPSTTVLCFDYGTRHIGIAVGQTITHTATPLTVLRARDGIPNWDEIKDIIEQWQPDLLVIGLPLNMDGSLSAISHRAKKFANRLHGRYGLPIELADERLSSFEAKGDIIRQTGSRDFKLNNIDGVAAQIILQSWFASNS